ncbi:MAG: hypothetical protein ACPG4U_10640 [Pseudomonadales bacterium]
MIEPLLSLFAMSVLLIGAPGPAAMTLAAMGSGHGTRSALPLIMGLTSGVVLTGLLSALGFLALL